MKTQCSDVNMPLSSNKVRDCQAEKTQVTVLERTLSNTVK